MDTPTFDDDTLGGQQKKYAPKDEDSIRVEVLDKEEEFNGLFSKVGKLKPYWDDFKTIFAMIKDWICGDYREVPFTTIASLAGMLIYVLCPVDLVADFLPVIGYLDDVALLAFTIKMSSGDIAKYRDWKSRRK